VAATPLAAARVLVTPTPFNSLLWRVVVMDDAGYHEGTYSLFDESPHVRLERHASDTRLLEPLREDWTVRRLAWFAKGFYAVTEAPDGMRVANGSASTLRQLFGLVDTADAADSMPGPDGVPIVMTDLRMGQTPWFVFSFVVAERDAEGVAPVPVQQVPGERPPATVLPRLWHRVWNESL
jgi:inner membrane protein